jgi:hypothetical protein
MEWTKLCALSLSLQLVLSYGHCAQPGGAHRVAEEAWRLVDGENVLVAIDLVEDVGGRRKEGVFGASIGYVSEDDLAGIQPALFTKHDATLEAKAALLDGGTHFALGDGDKSGQVGEESFAVPGAADSMTYWLVGGARHRPLL